MFVYADNAATTAMNKAAIDAMLPAMSDVYGNPSSLHQKGREANYALMDARRRVAACLGAEAREIYFTGCGTEADNWAITEAARLGAAQGKKHIISDTIEHHAVLHTLAKLEKQGFEVTYLPVHEEGVIRMEELEAAIRPDTCLVTIMYVNNEIGTVQPIRQIGKLCREKGILPSPSMSLSRIAVTWAIFSLRWLQLSSRAAAIARMAGIASVPPRLPRS